MYLAFFVSPLPPADRLTNNEQHKTAVVHSLLLSTAIELKTHRLITWQINRCQQPVVVVNVDSVLCVQYTPATL